ncbi:MAG: SpoIIE family protein phosphatase [Plectolyngbya sp. WJT66-NPBG17]|jgi:anti-sigma regulatory factor (Ser/Thr protein kinase)|nr:SpoIIE family protein phosphatase [Plectolyngbya sp. WJT66-NPBG17]
MTRKPIALPITEDSQVGEARRLAVTLSIELGFDETDRGRVALIVTEATRNLLKHAQNGELLIQPLKTAEGVGIEIIALDSAPGIQNVSQCLQDGFSTAGTPGTGLGAIQRLSAMFDIYSLPQVGTALVSRLWAQHEEANAPFEVGTVNLPKRRGEISGDAWAIEQQRDRALILVADGLGSGTLAAEASRTAVKIFRAHADLHPAEILDKIHAGLRSTRGAVAAIAEILPSAQLIRYAGIGNIFGAIVTRSSSRSMVSYNGTLGLTVRKVAEFSYPWSAESLLVMHSDGLGTQWMLDRYPGLINRHPALIAAILYRDFQRSGVRNPAGAPDDVAVLVAKLRNEEA